LNPKLQDRGRGKGGPDSVKGLKRCNGCLPGRNCKLGKLNKGCQIVPGGDQVLAMGWKGKKGGGRKEKKEEICSIPKVEK